VWKARVNFCNERCADARRWRLAGATQLGMLNCTQAEDSWVLNATELRHNAHRAANSLASKQLLAHRRMQNVLRRGGTVLATFLGGSVVTGQTLRNCATGISGPACAYPARAEKWMQQCSGLAGRFQVANQATGATTTISILPQLPEFFQGTSELGCEGSEPKLVVIDFSTNDAVFNSGSDPASQAKSPLLAATEVMLRWLLIERPCIGILMLDSDCTLPSHGKHHGTREVHQRAANHYGVAYLSFGSGFRDGIRCTRDPPVWTRSLRGSHPGPDSHQHVADELSLWLPRFFEVAGKDSVHHRDHTSVGYNTSLPPPIAPEEALAKHEICRQPVTTYSALAREYTQHGPWPRMQVTNGTWELNRERADKPGWQSDEGGSVLTFEMQFGAEPRLTIVYEQSYETFGDLKLSMRGSPNCSKSCIGHQSLTLPGRDLTQKSNATQATTLVVQLGDDKSMLQQGVFKPKYWNVPPFGNATVYLTNLGQGARQRVKVRRVSSC